MLIFAGDYKPDNLLKIDFATPVDQFIVNLECSFTDTAETGNAKAYPVIYPSERLDGVLGEAFCAVGVANNHIGDGGGSVSKLLQDKFNNKTYAT